MIIKYNLVQILILLIFKPQFLLKNVLQDGPVEHINLKVLGQDNSVIQFKIRKQAPLKKLMNAYCERVVSSKYFI